MLSLRDLQEAFVAGALHDYSAPIAAHILGKGIAPERRLAIYRNNAVEGFLKTLQATFPALQRLAGEGWFRQTGREYLRRHPSRSGNIHYVGERFATFLDAELAGTEYAYFADVARLEWAYQEVLVAADHPTFDVAALATVPPEQYAVLTFRVHPALRLVRSRFPVLAIWKVNQADSAVSERIDLASGSSSVLIIRREDHVELRELPGAEFELLAAFIRDETFEQAAGHVLRCAPQADLGVVLARIVQLGTLVDFTAPSKQ